jgi:hypothetical protein
MSPQTTNKPPLSCQVLPQLHSTCAAALDPDADLCSAPECRAALRCAGALLRRHVFLAPDAAPALLECVLAGCGPGRPAWQRIQSLAVLKSLASDPPLMYCLFRTYDMSIHRDVNAVHDTVRTAVDITKAFVKASQERPEDDLMEKLGSLHSARAAGKELQAPDGIEPPGGAGAAAAGGGGGGGAAGAGVYGEVWVAHSALELLIANVSALESLADTALRAQAEHEEGGRGDLVAVGPHGGELESPDSPGGFWLLSAVLWLVWGGEG